MTYPLAPITMRSMLVAVLLALICVSSSLAQFRVAEQQHKIELPVCRGLSWSTHSAQEREYFHFKYAGSATMCLSQLIFDSNLRLDPDIAPRLNSLCVLQAEHLHRSRAFQAQQDQLEQRFNQRVGNYQGQAPPYNDAELREAERLTQQNLQNLQDYDDAFLKIFPEKELRIRLLQHYARQRLSRDGLLIVVSLIYQCQGVWGREFKDQAGQKLGEPFLQRWGQFEEVCLSRFTSEFCEALKSSIDRLSPVQKERLLKILPLNDSELTFTRNANSKGGAYRRFLVQLNSADPKERHHAIQDSWMEVCRTVPPLSELRYGYGRMLLRHDSAKALAGVVERMIELQVTAALENEESLAELKASFAKFILNEDVVSALRHPVIMRFCKLEQVDIERLQARLQEHHDALQEQWASYVTAGALDALKDVLSQEDLADLESVVQAVDARAMNLITNLTPVD